VPVTGHFAHLQIRAHLTGLVYRPLRSLFGNLGCPLQGSPNSSQAPHQAQWPLWSNTDKTCQTLLQLLLDLLGPPSKSTILCGAKREHQLKCSEARKAMKRLWDFEGEKHEPSL